MRINYLVISIAILLASFNPIAAQKRIGEWKPISIGSTILLDSKVYGSAREINVWLPPGYSKGEKRYPVLYVVDGGLEQDFHHISGLAQLGTINGNYEDLIVVGIKTENRFMELTHEPKDPRYISNMPKAGASDKFYEHIKDEVIPYIERNHRTAERKALIGESLAGLFVTEVFLKHPDAFTDYVSVSPSLWWDDKALAKASNDLLRKHDDKPRRLYLTMANEGGTMQGGLDMILKSIEKVKPKNLQLFYVDRSKTDTHATIYHPAALDALKKLFGIEQPEPTENPWYLVEGGQPEN